MSIAVGFRCTDGIILCADRQIGNEAFKFYEPKISRIKLAPGAVILAYAGMPDTMKVIFQDLQKKAEGRNKTCDQVQVSLEETLRATLPRKPKDSHQMLLGIHDGHTSRLLKTFDKGISPVPSWDCVGFGDSALVRYLVGIFLKGGAPMSLYEAVPLCNYLVAQAKKYVQWCGGETDAVALTHDGKVLVQSSPYAKAVEPMFEALEYGLCTMLSTLAGDGSKEERDNAIELFQGLLKNLARTFKPFMDET